MDAAAVGRLVLLAVWELLVDTLHIPNYIFPAPSGIADAAIRMASSGLLFENALITLVETLLGFWRRWQSRRCLPF